MSFDISLLSLVRPLEERKSNSSMEHYSTSTMLSEVTNIQEKDIALEEDGKIVGWVSYHDLVKAVVDRWKRTLSYYNTLLGSVDDAITVIDENGVIQSWNQKSEEMYGFTAANVKGKKITSFFETESVVLMSTINDRKGVIKQYNQPKPDVHVLINTSPIIVDDEVIGGISVERNITEIVKLNDELSSTAASLHELERNVQNEQSLSPFSKIKGRSPVLQDALHLVKKVSKTDATVLITGESGVGKELFAEAIHKASNRSDAPFVAINCGAIPTALIESDLFGYDQGAFTGAVKGGKKGKFDAAKGGTIFLDEIGEMPLEVQVKLLRVLQEKQYYRVGGTNPLPTDVRIIAATHRDLERMIEEGSFREDLFYRLNVISIFVPPLKERKEDIPELIQLFLQEFSIKYKTPIPEIDPEVMYMFLQHPWQGNVRQLRNIIERLIISADENVRIEPKHLPQNFVKQLLPTIELNETSIPPTLENDNEIVHALKLTYGNKTAAAKLLGISRATLYNRMKNFK
ncbi:sigma-54 interaction domain-containing protein [Alkalihalobacterium alkalinitrilicum]|uniref:sigma-54 interaction domain-containing protein n=1 Tax=Alkalihalobacterium alkalinitrilicum TaxID=427920 RepID=UPI0009957517|nr:sigma 54-interacting transcriptional regulator [Alkalihalobacterium alkalinitrilicum]